MHNREKKLIIGIKLVFGYPLTIDLVYGEPVESAEGLTKLPQEFVQAGSNSGLCLINIAL